MRKSLVFVVLGVVFLVGIVSAYTEYNLNQIVYGVPSSGGSGGYYHVNFYATGIDGTVSCSGSVLSGGDKSLDCGATYGYTCHTDLQSGWRVACGKFITANRYYFAGYDLENYIGTDLSTIFPWSNSDFYGCGTNTQKLYRGLWVDESILGLFFYWKHIATCSGTDDNYCVNGRSSCGCKPGATKVVACGSGTCVGTRTDTCNSAGNWVVGSCSYPNAGTTCRASAGTCDQPESCTSLSSSCPVDSFKSSITVCRASAGTCDQPEYCTGSSPSCPVDSFRSSGTICSGNSQWFCEGDCKRTRTYSVCTGFSAPCPSLTTYVENAPAGTLCNQLKEGTFWITSGYCGYSPYNQCSGSIRGRDAYRCNGGNSCSYKVDVVWDGGTCSGLTPYCFEGGCVECIQNSDCPSGKVCQNKQCIISTEPYWATLSGDKINLSNRGDTVLMVAGDLESGESVEYFVEREGSILFGLIKNWEDLTKLGGKGAQQYTFDQEGKYRFKVEIKEGEEIFESPYQNISVSSVSSNSRPVADISAPIDFYRGSVNSPILFSQISFDDDDLLKITWNFGDNNNTIFQNYSKSLNANSADVSHFYSKEGNYVVTLIAEEMTRDQSDEDSIQVQIFKQGINVIPIISSPAMDSIQGYVVWYNASQSYVVNCSVGMVSPDFSVGSLGCKYILAPWAKSPSQGIVRIRWKEIDSEGNVLNWIVGSEQQGVVWNSTNYNDAVVFPKIYKKPEFRRIRLELTYN